MALLDAHKRQSLFSELSKTVDATFYDTWCRSLDVVEIDEDLFEVPCPNEYWKNLVEPRLREPLEQAFACVTGRVPRIVFRIDDRPVDLDLPPLPVPPPAPAAPEPRRGPQFTGLKLNDQFTFDSFIEGPTNRFARSAALYVAEHPFKQNLFIYGKSGVGKTHLMQAICHHVMRKHPNLHVAYMPCETFISDFVNSIKTRGTEEFRQKHKSVDFLVIDDVDLIANKEATQEEFFHIFNHLYLTGKQMVFSSDSPPRQIQTLKERLFSRLEGGLVVPIDPPNFEMRVAIVQKKAESKGKQIPDEVARFIAEHFVDNVRELEGAVVRVIALAFLAQRPIDLELAKEALREEARHVSRELTVDDIASMVASYYKMTRQDLLRKTHQRRLALAKQVCIYICYEFTDHSTRELAEMLKMSSHNSIFYSVQKIKNLLQRDPQLRRDVDQLLAELKRMRHLA